MKQNGLKSGFGIAGSARVGGSARGPDPPPPRVPTLGFGERFFEKNSRKMAFFWEVCVEKIDFICKVVVEKMDCAGDKMKTIAVLAACSHSVSHASTTPKFPAMPNRQ